MTVDIEKLKMLREAAGRKWDGTLAYEAFYDFCFEHAESLYQELTLLRAGMKKAEINGLEDCFCPCCGSNAFHDQFDRSLGWVHDDGCELAAYQSFLKENE